MDKIYCDYCGGLVRYEKRIDEIYIAELDGDVIKITRNDIDGDCSFAGLVCEECGEEIMTVRDIVEE